MKGNYYWRDQFFTSMIVGETVICIFSHPKPTWSLNILYCWCHNTHLGSKMFFLGWSWVEFRIITRFQAEKRQTYPHRIFLGANRWFIHWIVAVLTVGPCISSARTCHQFSGGMMGGDGMHEMHGVCMGVACLNCETFRWCWRHFLWNCVLDDSWMFCVIMTGQLSSTLPLNGVGFFSKKVKALARPREQHASYYR